MAAEQQAMIEELIAFLRSERQPLPFMGSFPQDFTNANFIGLDRLLTLLVEHQTREIAALENDLDGVQGAEVLVKKLLDLRKQHQKQLEELVARRTKPVPA